MVLPILIAVGQIERNQTSERVKTSIAYIRQQGGHYGKVPFGYQTVRKAGSKAGTTSEERPWLSGSSLWYRDGKQHTEIARLLNEHGAEASTEKTSGRCKWSDLLVRHGIHKPRSVQRMSLSTIGTAPTRSRTSFAAGTHAVIHRRAPNKTGSAPALRSALPVVQRARPAAQATYHDRATPQGCARFLKEQGLSLRKSASS